MTADQLVYLTERLDEEITRVRESVPYLSEATEPIEPSVALGRLTRMEAINEKGVNEEMLRQAKLRLERLLNARGRVDTGTYGACLRCRREITFPRLDAIPESVLCVACAGNPR